MSDNRYENLSKKSPEEAAAVVCEVEKRNYLAHSIREIENALSKAPYFRHYRIITLVPPNNEAGAVILFREKCCEIILPSNCETMCDKKVRLSLGHELGHLIRNFDKLNDSAVLDNKTPSSEEEVYAWQFAYHLIRLKSEQYRKEGMTKFVYGEEELKQTLRDLIIEKNPAIYDELPPSMRC